MTRTQISVVGSGDATESQREHARTVGELLGEENVTVVCGGGGGVMEAVARGVDAADGGLAVGIRPETDDRHANEYLDVVIPSGMGQARNVSVVLSGAAVIAVGGNYGTLTEIAYARKFDKAVFGVGTWEHDRFEFPSDLPPEDAVELALNEARR